MPVRKLTSEEGREIVWCCDENYEEVQSKVIDTSRWSICREGVFKDLRDGTFWKANWSVGATEYQCENPFEYDDEAVFVQVELKEVTVLKYVEVDD